jgi:hypothetical protein
VDESVYQFKLLRTTFVQNSVDSLAKLAFVFFPFERKEYAWGKVEPFGHGNDSVETWDFLSPFDISPKIGSYISAFGSLLETKPRAFSKFANALRELGTMFQCSMSQHDIGPMERVTQSIECFGIAHQRYREL